MSSSTRSLPTRALLTGIAVAAALLLGFAARAQAAELIYWNNYGAEPQSISYANIDGSGGGALNLTGATLVDPEGMAIDTATNRLFVASCCGGPDKKGSIIAANLDGTGASVFTAPGAPVDEPFGVAIDPGSRTIYWANYADDGTPSIAWAKLDGSVGGVVNTTGATPGKPYKVALDTVNGRIYWGTSEPGVVSLHYANLNNTGGGDPNLSGYEPDGAYGLAVDPAAGRLYWSDGDHFSYTGLLGGPVGALNVTGAVFNQSYGFAIDPTLGKIYWPNYKNGDDRVNGLGFASLSGGGGGNITPATAPFKSAQDAVVLKSPTGTAAPVIGRNPKARSQLTCPAGTWAADFAGSYVYQAPTTYAYQWLLNGKAISGSTAATLAATKPGKYTCAVTATNQAGAASQASAAAVVKASKAKLTTKKKVTVKAGRTATFKLKIANQGDLKSKNAKLCATLPKAAKGELKAPKCKSLGKLKGRGKKSATLKIKALPSASGVYSVSFKVKGTAGKAAKAKIVVK